MEETLRLDYVPVTQQYDVTIRSHQNLNFCRHFLHAQRLVYSLNPILAWNKSVAWMDCLKQLLHSNGTSPCTARTVKEQQNLSFELVQNLEPSLKGFLWLESSRVFVYPRPKLKLPRYDSSFIHVIQGKLVNRHWYPVHTIPVRHCTGIKISRYEPLRYVHTIPVEVQFHYGFTLRFKSLRLALRFHAFSYRYRVNARPNRNNFVTVSFRTGIVWTGSDLKRP